MEKIRVGIIGCGRISDLHYPGYEAQPSASVVAVCDTNPELGKQKKEAWGAARFYQDYQELLADLEIDAVEILSPQPLHETMVIDAAKAGKHIALQKPMTINLESADRMLEAVNASHCLFKVSDNYLFYPPIMLAKSLIDQGEIGNPINIRIKMISGGSGGWHVPPSAWAWRTAENAEGRGLQTFDHGHHLWAVAWYLMGRVERVVGWIDSLDGIVDSPAVIMWKYEDGIKYGSCEYAYSPQLHIPSHYYANDEWFEITGSKGIIVIHRCTGEIVKGPGLTLFNGQTWKQFDEVQTDWKEGFIGSTRNFIEAINGRAKPLLSGDQAREILKLNLAISKSAAVRREVYVDELDAPVPWAYSRQRIRKEMAEKRAKRKQHRVQPAKEQDPDTIREEAKRLTKSLIERFDASKAADWEATITIRLKQAGGRPDLTYWLTIANQTVRLEQENPHRPASLDIQVAAQTWVAILTKAKTVEEAFAGGELVLDGKIEHGLKLTEVFSI